MEISSGQLPTQTVCDSTQTDTYPYLVPTKTVGKRSAAPGDNVQYTITVKNIGTGPTASPVMIDEYLPAGFTFVSKDSVTVNGADLTAATSVTTASPYSPNQPRFSVPAAINAGKSLVITFTAKVPANATPGSYCNYFAVTQGGIPLTTGSQACVTVGGAGNGKIGDTIFRDWNGNGIQDAGEEGIAGRDGHPDQARRRHRHPGHRRQRPIPVRRPGAGLLHRQRAGAGDRRRAGRLCADRRPRRHAVQPQLRQEPGPG